MPIQVDPLTMEDIISDLRRVSALLDTLSQASMGDGDLPPSVVEHVSLATQEITERALKSLETLQEKYCESQRSPKEGSLSQELH